MMMKTLKVLIVPLWMITLAAVACMKKAVDQVPPHPEMHYVYLNDLEIKPNTFFHVDIDGNGSADFTFHTMLVGDPVLKRDRLQFLVGSKIGTNLLNNEQDESPRLKKDDRIGLKHEGFTWYELSSIVLAEKIVPVNENFSWDGIWKSASHNFLPVQVIKNDKPYYGWIEISFDRDNQKLVLHRAAISTESDKEIKAGY